MVATSSAVATSYERARDALARGELEQAREAFESLLKRSRDPAIAFMLGKTLAELGRTDEAIVHTESAHRASPSPDTLRNLARLYWLQGEDTAFEALLLEQLTHRELAFVAVELCRQSDRLNPALEMLARMPGDTRRFLEFPLSAAWIYIELGDAARALQCAELAYRGSPDFAGCLEAYASALLMNGRYDEARTLCSEAVSKTSDSVHATALLLVAERLLGVLETDELRSVILPLQLDAPTGFADIAAFNDVLRRDVDAFHCYRRHPVDQSLRGGSQTCRNLANCGLPSMEAYLEQCLQGANSYLQTVEDRRHPYREPVTPEINKCWGVRLQPGGFHRSHIHPEGFLSAAYYLTTPDAGDGEKGAIRFGVPPFDLPDELDPILQISPTEGLLVLFPSYLWHGTIPTQAGAAAAVRETLPFDVTPAVHSR
jgi:tetratricopeptide (TPR) repeat protein